MSLFNADRLFNVFQGKNALVFRETNTYPIPGINHVGLLYGGRVYESLSGYGVGEYFDPLEYEPYNSGVSLGDYKDSTNRVSVEYFDGV